MKCRDSDPLSASYGLLIRRVPTSAEPVNFGSVVDQLRLDHASQLLVHVADTDASFSRRVSGLSVRNSNPPAFSRWLFSSISKVETTGFQPVSFSFELFGMTLR